MPGDVNQLRIHIACLEDDSCVFDCKEAETPLTPRSGASCALDERGQSAGQDTSNRANEAVSCGRIVSVTGSRR